MNEAAENIMEKIFPIVHILPLSFDFPGTPYHCRVNKYQKWQIVHEVNWLTCLAPLEESQALF